MDHMPAKSKRSQFKIASLAIFTLCLAGRANAAGANWPDAIASEVFVVGFLLALSAAASAFIYRRKQQRLYTENHLLTERLSFALESGRIAVWEYEPETDRLSWTEEMWNLYGYDGDVSITPDIAWRNGLDEESWADFRLLLEKLQKGSEFEEMRFRIQLPDASLKWVYCSAKAKADEMGHLRILGINKDISDTYSRFEEARQLAEQSQQATARAEELNTDLLIYKEELEAQNDNLVETIAQKDEAEDQYRALFFSSPAACLLLDSDLFVVDVNPAACELTGRPEQRLLGRHVDLFFKSLTSEGLNNYSREAETLEVPAWTRTELYRPNQKNLPVRLLPTALQLRGKRSFLLIITDLTAELAKERSFQEAIAAKSQFVANMSHEIRTPLHGVVGNLSLIEQRGRLAEEDRESLRSAVSSANYLAKVLDDILDYSKLEVGGYVLRPSFIDIRSSIEEWLRLLKPLADEKSIRLDSHYQLNTDKNVSLDPTRLRQIINNLVGNAIKFTMAGSVRVDVGLYVQDGEETGLLEIAVKDTGVGLKPEDIERILSPYIQAQDPRTKETIGTGLGLSITKKLIDLMDGELIVDSTVGQGSVFTCRLRPQIGLDSSQSSELLNKPKGGVQAPRVKFS